MDKSFYNECFRTLNFKCTRNLVKARELPTVTASSRDCLEGILSLFLHRHVVQICMRQNKIFREMSQWFCIHVMDVLFDYKKNENKFFFCKFEMT